MRIKWLLFILTLITTSLWLGIYCVDAWDPLPIADDPRVRMPGTQPNEVTMNGSSSCLICHADYDHDIEPGFNWQGSMMAQSARDFLFWSTLTVAAQDSIWLLGNPNAADMCFRCHTPNGWLNGNSDPANGTGSVAPDFDGVQCEFCHRMYDPFFATTYDGSHESSDWLNYWDESGLDTPTSQARADETFAVDSGDAATVTHFNGSPFFANDKPVSVAYTGNASGQYFVSNSSAMRGSFADAQAPHQTYYSRYHKSKYFCSTCHDVSNSVLANLNADPNQILPTEVESAFNYHHVERTFSEFMLSNYGLDGGSPGRGAYANDIFNTSKPNNYIGSCQDCHMPDGVGVASVVSSAVYRPDDSIEHPQSGQPVHDLTGGNMWVPYILASTVPESPNYDPMNAQLLGQGPLTLTLDLNAGIGLNPEALLAGSQRAQHTLQNAANITHITYDPVSGELNFRIENHTGHKLITGYPEGRRMFVNLKVYREDVLVYEINPYDDGVGTLRGLPTSDDSPPLGANEVYEDALVYEMKPSSSLTGETITSHFILGDSRYKDNRIPPVGFRIDEAVGRMAEPVWQGYSAITYFTADEYAGGYDAVNLMVPAAANRIELQLYYQTTSREYIAFLRDEINGSGNLTLTNPPPSREPEAYIVQTDPFFAQLRAWGDTIWALWLHNKDVPGAYPVMMTTAVWHSCELPDCSGIISPVMTVDH